MPAYEEAFNLAEAFNNLMEALKRSKLNLAYDVWIVTNNRPDGKTDGTDKIASGLEKQNRPKVKWFHFQEYVGLGLKYYFACQNSTNDYVMMVPGDNEFNQESVIEILKHFVSKDVDLIIPYINNPGARGLKRRILSSGFVKLCNWLFGLNLRYYNGLCVIKRDLVSNLVPKLKSEGYTYLAEILIKLIKSGIVKRYLEVPFDIKASKNSKAFNFKTVFNTLLWLWQVKIKKLY